MGRGGLILGLIALLLGASGLGIGLITWIDQGKTDFWYDYKGVEYYPPAYNYYTVPDLYVIVELNAPATVHIIFSTSTRILPDPGSFADILFYFWINEERLLNPYTRAGPYQGDATYQYYPVILQHSLTLSAGTHNISIVVFSETPGNLIRQSAIAVTRY
ncbi:MAG: hypothetical protein ACFE85_16185 [Candidatus Hodarchaeota archaeon]